MSFKSWFNRIDNNVAYGVANSCNLIAAQLRDIKYDGLLGFSQGGIMIRHYLRIASIIDSEAFKEVPLPRFVITVASPVFERTEINYKEANYQFEGSRHLDVPSLHLCGLQDQLFPYLSHDKLFTLASNPRKLIYDDGHKFPRSLTTEN